MDPTKNRQKRKCVEIGKHMQLPANDACYIILDFLLCAKKKKLYEVNQTSFARSKAEGVK